MKKKILALCVCAAMLATALVGGTLAYFTDKDVQTNTFTAGNVDINLDEAVVKTENGNLVADGDKRTEDNQSYELFPAQTVDKDPTITVGGTEDTYVGAIVTVTGDIYDLIGVTGYDNIDITKLASGGLMVDAATQVTDWNGLSMVYETDKCVIYQDADKDAKKWTLYVFMKDVQKPGDKVVLFETLTIPATWDNAEMAKINGMAIDVKAFATQANGFDHLEKNVACYTALTTAFNEDGQFKFN